MDSLVTLQKEGPIAVVTLNRPDKYNGLTIPMLRELIATAKRIRRDRTLRAVVLRGEGPAFSAGLDFANATKKPLEIVKAFLRNPLRPRNTFQEAAWCWRNLPIPVIAAIHGHCYGAGLQVALAADFRDCAPDARLSLMEARWGMVPDLTGTLVLRELMPLDTAKDLVMHGTVLSGEEAKAINLVTALADDPYAAAMERAQQLALRSPDAVSGTKKLLQANWNASERRAFRNERTVQLRILIGKNQSRAMKANFAGEEPRFGPRSKLL
ncbi:crotonase/enoyl-CoA hydratase family protein [Alkalilimnicola ehrlichii]|nr:crotonase/enoyl-CoA hydratase family protein [Alkalilimnicola ehrlichii]